MIGSRDYEEEIHELRPLSERNIRINGEPVGKEALARYEDVAEYLDVHPVYLRKLVAAGRIPHYKIDRRVRFRMSEVDAWLAERGKGQKRKRAT